MGRKSLGTMRNAKTPRHMKQIAMTSENYYELKVYIKSIVLPGTPGFECARLGTKESKQIYRQWLNNALEEIGPRFFPGGGKSLVWPKNRERIYKAVHHAVRVMSIGIRNNHKKGILMGAHTNGDDNEMEITQDDDLSEGKGTDDSNDAGVKEDFIVPDEDERYALWEQREEANMMAFIEMMDQGNQADYTMEEGMDAELVELEDLLDLMKPEGLPNFPNLDDEDFDWDESPDPTSSDPIGSLLLLLP